MRTGARFDLFTAEARGVIAEAAQLARRQDDGFIGLVHVRAVTPGDAHGRKDTLAPGTAARSGDLADAALPFSEELASELALLSNRPGEVPVTPADLAEAARR